jgi:hypothetical protein
VAPAYEQALRSEAAFHGAVGASSTSASPSCWTGSPTCRSDGASGPRPARRPEPRLAQVEDGQLAFVQRLLLVHQRLEFRGRLVAFAFARLPPRGEVHRVGVADVACRATRPPMRSGRKSPRTDSYRSLSVRIRSASRTRPRITWTKPASSEPPRPNSTTSRQSWKVTSPLNSFAVPTHHWCCSGRSLVRRAASSDSSGAL